MISSMRTLILIAHGSRRKASNDEVRKLAATMNQMEHGFDRVSCAFLELAEPLIPDGIRQSIAGGAKEIIVLPYFLSAGRHVVEDVPADVEKVQKEFPEVTISLTPYLGSAPSIADAVLQLALDASGE